MEIILLSAFAHNMCQTLLFEHALYLCWQTRVWHPFVGVNQSLFLPLFIIAAVYIPPRCLLAIAFGFSQGFCRLMIVSHSPCIRLTYKQSFVHIMILWDRIFSLYMYCCHSKNRPHTVNLNLCRKRYWVWPPKGLSELFQCDCFLWARWVQEEWTTLTFVFGDYHIW